MNWVLIIGIVLLLFYFIKPGRMVIFVALGLIYMPFQHLFMWLQKINLGLKDKDQFLYYLSCIIIYPLYAIIIPFSKFYEMISEKLKE